jgi:hypothetical protein
VGNVGASFDDYYMICAESVAKGTWCGLPSAHALLILGGYEFLAKRAWDYVHHPSVAGQYVSDGGPQPVTPLSLWWHYTAQHWDEPVNV